MQYDQFFAGEYQIEKTLERSQYSVLCAGKKSTTGQPVLLKLWLTAQPASEEEQTRIREEVAALQKVNHAHLLPVLEVQADGQKVFLVSEFAPEGSLNERLGQEAEEAFSLDEKLQIIEQVGQALQALHEQKIIHGNLTPQAVFFAAPGLVRLGEALVRSVLVSIQDYQHILDENIPRCLYMAPEQFSGTLNTKTDQYALGCLAYMLLTGRVPFAGSARSTLLQKHQRDEPQALTSLNPAVPAHIEAAVLKALAKEPEKRYASVQAFLGALDASGKKALADQNTIRQAVPDIHNEETMADGLWEWEVSVPPEGPLEDSGPVRAAVATTAPARRPTFPLPSLSGSRPGQGSRKRELYVMVPALLLVFLLLFLGGRWLFFPGPSSSVALRPQTRTHLASPTSMLLTPATATGPQSTATASVAVVQVPTPTPTPLPVPSPVPTTGSAAPSATATPAVLLGVNPFVNCVLYQGHGNYIAKFGYQNNNSYVVTIPLGSKNSTFPEGLQATPPTVFSPGRQDKVFQVNFSNFRYDFVGWTLNGVTAFASTDDSTQNC